MSTTMSISESSDCLEITIKIPRTLVMLDAPPKLPVQGGDVPDQLRYLADYLEGVNRTAFSNAMDEMDRIAAERQEREKDEPPQ